MDPFSAISLLEALGSLARSIIQKFDSFETHASEERKLALKYKKSVQVFANEVDEVKVLFKTIVIRGDTTAVSALLKSNDGKDAFERLSIALRLAETLLRRQDSAAQKLISSLTWTEERRGPFLTGFDEENFQEFKRMTEEAFDTLDERVNEISRLFTLFHRLYLLHNVPRKSEPIAWGAEPWQVGTSLDILQLSFYLNPFTMVISDTDRPEVVGGLHSLNSTRHWAERHAHTMEAAGRRWVEDQLTDGITVPALGRIQLDLMERLWKVLSDSSSDIHQAVAPDVASGKEWVEMLRSIHSAFKRSKGQRFSIAFCGMVKAGKSLFLNALMGRTILPSNELPSTAWPCRLRHVKGQLTPTLEVDTTAFQMGIAGLQARGYGKMMANYTPPTDDPFAGILDDVPSTTGIPNADEAHLKVIYIHWVDLHPATRANLMRFETRGFYLPPKVEGEDAVRGLLNDLNDVVRLCHRFRVPFNMSHTEWPLLSVEFDSLRHEEIDGVFEFIDLPGIGESFEDYNFEELICRVAKEVNAVVPIVSFKELPKEDWRRLPAIISAGIGRPPDLVLCTHFDQISRDNLPEQLANVAKVFWPNSPASTSRVLPCSSKMGLSAYTLLRKSASEKPRFIDMWNNKTIEYDCAEKILGVGDPGPNFAHFSHDDWKRSVEYQLKLSGLQSAIKKLTTDMVLNSQQHSLLLEGERLRRQLHKAVSDQKRILLEMRRSEEDYEHAYNDFKKAKETFGRVLSDWSLGETRMHMDSSAKLQKSFEVLEKRGLMAASAAVQAVSARTPQAQPTPGAPAKVDVLIFAHIVQAETFLYDVQQDLSQSLTKLKHQFVGLVRDLANRSRAEHFEALKGSIQESIQADVQQELQAEIVDELTTRGVSVETLMFTSIKRDVVQKIATRYNASTAFRAIEDALAKPLIRSPNPAAVLNDNWSDFDRAESEARTRGIEELGFMVRAPIAVIASVPWVLGAGIWPFMAKSKQYHMDKVAIAQKLDMKVVGPFLEQLKSEGQKTLDGMMTKSSTIAREAVEGALEKEEQRYQLERSKKELPPTKSGVAGALAALSNFLAAETALLKVQSYLKELV
ncbi:hypothetical protein BD410DRAFT_787351 [Rickenella mellea]|uniref:Dynamin N-terminal domain-containing protein n=1 Tax=Rickenella mellea TaxID=50990 RepID=A0A4Y7Q8R7_9AGAM|nr:hypothetical protein BD410DRAFT_787351 [Rickenella mellea]